MRDSDNREAINSMARELLRLIDGSTTHMVDEIRHVPARDYLDEARFATERSKLFRQTPLVVAFSAELREVGSFKLHEETGVSVLVVRNEEGKAKAFVNACRHRGAKLTEEPCGRQKRFTCPYHAWSYDVNGALAALPAQQLFGEVDKAQLGLVELPCEERHGMIFAVLTPGAKMDLDSFLAGGEELLGGWHLERNALVGRRDLETRANWKLALDSYCENYHFHVLHSADFSYKVMNCAHHVRFGDKGQHWYIAWPSKSIEDLRDKPESEWVDAHQHFSILHFIYPNTIMALYPETFSVKQLYPGETVAEQTTKMTFFSRDTDPSDDVRAIIQKRFDVFYKVLQQEDYWVCAGAYKNLESGVLSELLFGRNEPALTWLHDALDEGVGLAAHETDREPVTT
jgi:Phenylpropionate dioxygenase and related ring-hydroxylating dioxygenases, large terminal subunit